jgi:hypothetical protein
MIFFSFSAENEHVVTNGSECSDSRSEVVRTYAGIPVRRKAVLEGRYEGAVKVLFQHRFLVDGERCTGRNHKSMYLINRSLENNFRLLVVNKVRLIHSFLDLSGVVLILEEIIVLQNEQKKVISRRET